MTWTASDMLPHTIPTGTAQQIFQPPRRATLYCRETVCKLLDDMLSMDVLHPFKSLWAAPMVLVQKKDEVLPRPPQAKHSHITRRLPITLHRQHAGYSEWLKVV